MNTFAPSLLISYKDDSPPVTVTSAQLPHPTRCSYPPAEHQYGKLCFSRHSRSFPKVLFLLSSTLQMTPSSWWFMIPQASLRWFERKLHRNSKHSCSASFSTDLGSPFYTQRHSLWSPPASTSSPFPSEAKCGRQMLKTSEPTGQGSRHSSLNALMSRPLLFPAEALPGESPWRCLGLMDQKTRGSTLILANAPL